MLENLNMDMIIGGEGAKKDDLTSNITLSKQFITMSLLYINFVYIIN